MTLSNFIKELQKLEEQGHGDKQMFTTHSASGCTSELNYPRVSNYVGECGPYDLAPGEYYVDVCNGY